MPLKDILAEHAPQLMHLEKDEHREQRGVSSTGASQAKYGGAYGGSFNSVTTYVSSCPPPASEDSYDSDESDEPEALPGPPGLNVQLRQDEPAVVSEVVAPPPGLGIQPSQDDPEVMPTPIFATSQTSCISSSTELERAADLVKAEIREKHTAAEKSRKQSKNRNIPETKLVHAAPTERLSPSSQPALVEASQYAKPPAAANLVSSLRDALSDPALPAGATAQLRQFVETTAQQIRHGGSGAKGDSESLKAIKLLRQTLEKQQEESAQKIMKAMQGQVAQPQPASVKWLRQELEKQQVQSMQKMMKAMQDQQLQEQRMTPPCFDNVPHGPVPTGAEFGRQAWPWTSPEMHQNFPVPGMSAAQQAPSPADFAMMLGSYVKPPAGVPPNEISYWGMEHRHGLPGAHPRQPVSSQGWDPNESKSRHFSGSGGFELPALSGDTAPLPSMSQGIGCGFPGLKSNATSQEKRIGRARTEIGPPVSTQSKVVGCSVVEDDSGKSKTLVQQLRRIIYEDAESQAMQHAAEQEVEKM